MGDEDLPRLREAVKLARTPDVDLGGSSQIARVDADHARAQRSRAPECDRFVGFEQDAHVECVRVRHQRSQLLVRQRLRDEQNRIGAGGPGLHDLPLMNDHVLAEDHRGG